VPTPSFQRRYLGRGHGRELRHGRNLEGLQGGTGGCHGRALGLVRREQAGGGRERAGWLAGEYLLQRRLLRQWRLLLGARKRMGGKRVI